MGKIAKWFISRLTNYWPQRQEEAAHLAKTLPNSAIEQTTIYQQAQQAQEERVAKVTSSIMEIKRLYDSRLAEERDARQEAQQRISKLRSALDHLEAHLYETRTGLTAERLERNRLVEKKVTEGAAEKENELAQQWKQHLIETNKVYDQLRARKEKEDEARNRKRVEELFAEKETEKIERLQKQLRLVQGGYEHVRKANQELRAQLAEIQRKPIRHLFSEWFSKGGKEYIEKPPIPEQNYENGAGI